MNGDRKNDRIAKAGCINVDLDTRVTYNEMCALWWGLRKLELLLIGDVIPVRDAGKKELLFAAISRIQERIVVRGQDARKQVVAEARVHDHDVPDYSKAFP